MDHSISSIRASNAQMPPADVCPVPDSDYTNFVYRVQRDVHVVVESLPWRLFYIPGRREHIEMSVVLLEQMLLMRILSLY